MLPDTFTTFIIYGLGLYLAYFAVIAIYRVTIHPLAHIPGPRLAAITYLYEWYHDIYHIGRFPWKLRELHEKYGPIIRITPDEVHIKDPDFAATLYSRSNGRTDKPDRAAEMFGPFPAAISTAPHDHHRLRRSALNPFFSRKSVAELVPAMTHAIDVLCQRLQDACKTGELVNLKYIYAAVTSDIIDGYCFAREPTKVRERDFGKGFFDDIDSFLEVSLLNFHIPTIMRISFALPDSINKLLAPAMAAMLDFREDLGRQIDAIRHGRDKAYEGIGHRTVLHELLSSSLPPAELKTPRLRDEAFSLMVAGSGTTAYTLRSTTYHIASNPVIRARLHAELSSAIPDPSQPPSMATLEKLPYLTAVINEGLRLSEPVTHRLPRILRDKPLTYKSYTLPPGTTISMTGSLTHQDPAIFPDPHTFNPERWLFGGSEADRKKLETYLVPFSKGPRICLGMNLAMAELYLILAMVFRRFEFDTRLVKRERDVDVSFSFVVAAQAKESPGLEVTVQSAK